MYLADVCTIPVNIAGLPGVVRARAGCPRGCRSGSSSSAGRGMRPGLLRIGRAYEAITAGAEWRALEPRDLPAAGRSGHARAQGRRPGLRPTSPDGHREYDGGPEIRPAGELAEVAVGAGGYSRSSSSFFLASKSASADGAGLLHVREAGQRGRDLRGSLREDRLRHGRCDRIDRRGGDRRRGGDHLGHGR